MKRRREQEVTNTTAFFELADINTVWLGRLKGIVEETARNHGLVPKFIENPGPFCSDLMVILTGPVTAVEAIKSSVRQFVESLNPNV